MSSVRRAPHLGYPGGVREGRLWEEARTSAGQRDYLEAGHRQSYNRHEHPIFCGNFTLFSQNRIKYASAKIRVCTQKSQSIYLAIVHYAWPPSYRVPWGGRTTPEGHNRVTDGTPLPHVSREPVPLIDTWSSATISQHLFYCYFPRHSPFSPHWPHRGRARRRKLLAQ